MADSSVSLLALTPKPESPFDCGNGLPVTNRPGGPAGPPPTRNRDLTGISGDELRRVVQVTDEPPVMQADGHRIKMVALVPEGASAAGPGPGRLANQVRGFLAERVILSTALDPFMTLRALATYSGISVRKLRDHLDDPGHPLPHYRVGGKILVRRSEFDGWMATHQATGRGDVGRIVDDVLQGLRAS